MNTCLALACLHQVSLSQFQAESVMIVDAYPSLSDVIVAERIEVMYTGQEASDKIQLKGRIQVYDLEENKCYQVETLQGLTSAECTTSFGGTKSISFIEYNAVPSELRGVFEDELNHISIFWKNGFDSVSQEEVTRNLELVGKRPSEAFFDQDLESIVINDVFLYCVRHAFDFSTASAEYGWDKTFLYSSNRACVLVTNPWFTEIQGETKHALPSPVDIAGAFDTGGVAPNDPVLADVTVCVLSKTAKMPVDNDGQLVVCKEDLLQNRTDGRCCSRSSSQGLYTVFPRYMSWVGEPDNLQGDTVLDLVVIAQSNAMAMAPPVQPLLGAGEEPPAPLELNYKAQVKEQKSGVVRQPLNVGVAIPESLTSISGSVQFPDGCPSGALQVFAQSRVGAKTDVVSVGADGTFLLSWSPNQAPGYESLYFSPDMGSNLQMELSTTSTSVSKLSNNRSFDISSLSPGSNTVLEFTDVTPLERQELTAVVQASQCGIFAEGGDLGGWNVQIYSCKGRLYNTIHNVGVQPVHLSTQSKPLSNHSFPYTFVVQGVNRSTVPMGVSETYLSRAQVCVCFLFPLFPPKSFSLLL